MPEGPEVKVVTDGMNCFFQDRVLIDVDIIGGRYKTHGPPKKYQEFKNSLPLEIEKINCKGKFIWFSFKNSEWTVGNLLGMTGSWTYETNLKHNHVEFITDDKNMYYNDMRHLGQLIFMENKNELERMLNKRGPDMLSSSVDEFNAMDFIQILRKHNKKKITVVLMSQNIISGVGNIYKSESLYKSGISPHNTVGEISDLKLESLYYNIRDILKASYQVRGSSIRSFKDVDGEVGSFKSYMKVYNRKFDDIGNEIKWEKTEDGRTTYWVPSLQT